MELIGTHFALSANIIYFIFRLIAAGTTVLIMTSKGRSGILWGMLAFIFPFIIFFLFLVPAKEPKFPSEFRKHPAFEGLNPTVASIMVLTAIVAKADGRVTTSEVKLIREFILKRYRITSSDLDQYEKAFNYGKEHPEQYSYFTSVIRQSRRYDTRSSLSYFLVGMAIQEEGTLSLRMDQLLRKLTSDMGLSAYEYMSILRYYRMRSAFANGVNFESGSRQNWSNYNKMYGGTSQQDQVKRYSEVLGVSESADMREIKKAYRKLAKEYHPDRMVNEGMTQEYIDYANKRISEINEAYEYLKKVKEAA